MNHSIPNRLNALIVAMIATAAAASIVAVAHVGWLGTLLVGLFFAVVMNAVYCVIHEAEHRALFSNAFLNHATGTILAIFMPSSYTLMRRVHLAHHIHNRSDGESFDLYFADEPAAWKKIQFYGILIGTFWLTMAAGNVIIALLPFSLIRRTMRIDRPSDAFMQSVHRRLEWRIRIESIAAIVVHAGIAFLLGAAAWKYLAIYALFGCVWSGLQYIHHYDVGRDVLRGAKNLNYGSILNRIWMHHGWHLTHHLHPRVSWLHLPKLVTPDERPTETFGQAYLKMWRGPILTSHRTTNEFAGDVGQD